MLNESEHNKFVSSLYWLVFRLSEDENRILDLPSDLTMPCELKNDSTYIIKSDVIKYLCSGYPYYYLSLILHMKLDPLINFNSEKIIDKDNNSETCFQLVNKYLNSLSINGFLNDFDFSLIPKLISIKNFNYKLHLKLLDNFMLAYSYYFVNVSQILCQVRYLAPNIVVNQSFSSTNLENALVLWFQALTINMNLDFDKVIKNTFKNRLFFEFISHGMIISIIILKYFPKLCQTSKIYLDEIQYFFDNFLIFDHNELIEKRKYFLSKARKILGESKTLLTVLSLSIGDLLFPVDSFKFNFIVVLCELFFIISSNHKFSNSFDVSQIHIEQANDEIDLVMTSDDLSIEEMIQKIQNDDISNDLNSDNLYPSNQENYDQNLKTHISIHPNKNNYVNERLQAIYSRIANIKQKNTIINKTGCENIYTNNLENSNILFNNDENIQILQNTENFSIFNNNLHDSKEDEEILDNLKNSKNLYFSCHDTSTNSNYKNNSNMENCSYFVNKNNVKNSFRNIVDDRNSFRNTVDDRNLFRNTVDDQNSFRNTVDDRNSFRNTVDDQNSFRNIVDDQNSFGNIVDDQNSFRNIVDDQNSFGNIVDDGDDDQNLLGNIVDDQNLFRNIVDDGDDDQNLFRNIVDDDQINHEKSHNLTNVTNVTIQDFENVLNKSCEMLSIYRNEDSLTTDEDEFTKKNKKMNESLWFDQSKVAEFDKSASIFIPLALEKSNKLNKTTNYFNSTDDEYNQNSPVSSHSIDILKDSLLLKRNFESDFNKNNEKDFFNTKSNYTLNYISSISSESVENIYNNNLENNIVDKNKPMKFFIESDTINNDLEKKKQKIFAKLDARNKNKKISDLNSESTPCFTKMNSTLEKRIAKSKGLVLQSNTNFIKKSNLPKINYQSDMNNSKISHLLSQKVPKLYTPMKVNSNRSLIHNALTYYCLAGDANKKSRDKAIEQLSLCNGTHFLVHLKSTFQYRGLYVYYPDQQVVTRIHGIGPRHLDTSDVVSVYRYQTDKKIFEIIPVSKTISISCDAFTIATIQKTNTITTSI